MTITERNFNLNYQNISGEIFMCLSFADIEKWCVFIFIFIYHYDYYIYIFNHNSI